MATAAEVPGKYDVVINGQGYTFLRTLDGSYLSANRHRAEYTFTPTFVERQNVSSAYGDDQQAFWLTAFQSDWSLGQGQRFFRAADPDKKRRYWRGISANVAEPGQVSMGLAAGYWTQASSFVGSGPTADGTTVLPSVISSTNLYTIDSAATKTDKGAHGAGATPTTACPGLRKIYMSTTAAGTVGVRAYNGAAFSTFSATASDKIAYLNNALYGVVDSTGVLQTYSTAGVATTVFTWKDADGTAKTPAATVKVVPFGGKLVIVFQNGEVWLYDGAATVKIADFGVGNNVVDACVAQGILFVSATVALGPSSRQGVIYYWNSGTVGVLWKETLSSGGLGYAVPYLAPWAAGLAFAKSDDLSSGTTGLYYYDLPSASLQYLASPGSNVHGLVAGVDSLVSWLNGTGGCAWPSATVSSQTLIFSSLFDFDSSLTKLFRGVVVDWDPAPDGNGGSVDIGYAIGRVDGTFSGIQSGAVSGTEYLLSGVSGRSIIIQVLLNKGTSTAGPKLKRVYVRAAPILQSYKFRTYNLDLSSTDAHQTVLQDGSFQTLSGFTQAQNLQTAITSTTPFSITDKFGTFTGVCEPAQCSILELHSEGSTPTTPGQFIAQITVREV